MPFRLPTSIAHPTAYFLLLPTSPLVLGFRELTPGVGRHIVTLVDYGAEEVRVIDSNDKDGRIRTMPLKRFLSWWDGFALVIEPKDAD